MAVLKIFILVKFAGKRFTYRGKTCRIETVRGYESPIKQAVDRVPQRHRETGVPV